MLDTFLETTPPPHPFPAAPRALPGISSVKELGQGIGKLQSLTNLELNLYGTGSVPGYCRERPLGALRVLEGLREGSQEKTERFILKKHIFHF